MLVDLNKVDWGSLGTVSGSASEIPHALLLLTSDSEKERTAGYWKIDNHVVVQSDLFTAAPFVVPFLLEILANRTRPGASLVYDLLYEIGGGGAPEETMTDFRLPGWSTEELPLQRACYDAVKSGLDLYLKDIVHAEMELKMKAVELVQLLADECESVQEKLDAAVDSIEDLEIRNRLRAVD